MRLTTIVIWAGALSIVSVPMAAAQDHAALLTEGSAVFKKVGCSNCHTVRGVGTPLAPDLSRIGSRYDAAYLARWLRDPREVRPSGHMPALELSESDIQALAAYLASQRGQGNQ
jgi:cytochrome c553